jgi:hypothetical protein
LPCRVILCERALDEVLDSQERMLIRRNQPAAATPERRRMLKEEYIRTLARARALLERRPRTQVLTIQHSAAVSDARVTAKKVNDFLGGAMDVSKMAAVIDPALHRNRSGPVTGPRP